MGRKILLSQGSAQKITRQFPIARVEVKQDIASNQNAAAFYLSELATDIYNKNTLLFSYYILINFAISLANSNN